MLVAKRRLKVGDGFREIGQPVPEAETWESKPDLLKDGAIGYHVAFEPQDLLEMLSPEQLKKLAADRKIDTSSGMKRGALIQALLLSSPLR